MDFVSIYNYGCSLAGLIFGKYNLKENKTVRIKLELKPNPKKPLIHILPYNCDMRK